MMAAHLLQQPRRILMTADAVGGVWTYAMELARALEPHSVEILLATMGSPPNFQQRQEAGSLANVELIESAYKLEWMDEPWTDVVAAGAWLLELERRFQPELIHLNGYAHGSLPWRAPVLIVGHSCVLSWWRAVHGAAAPANWDTYREAVRTGLRAAQLVVAPTRAMRAQLVAEYGPLAQTQVIANGRRLPGLNTAKEPFILTAGRLWDAAKNISALEDIAPQLPWPVYAAGEEANPGKGEGRLKAINGLGRLSGERLLPWLARASIYALPARYEPFGLSILEAALAGCALVLGDIPSLREIWGEAALYVSPDDPDSLRRTLTELAVEPEQLTFFASKAQRAAAAYTPERMAWNYLQAYRQTLHTAERAFQSEVLAA